MVMNGDLLTDIDYAKLHEYHVSGGQSATVATATREVQISLGVLDVDADRRLVGFREKPKSSFQVSMGIYMFNPSILKYVPQNVNYGFDKLMLDMLAAKDPVRSYPFSGLWLDIGRHEDYALATDEFERHRDRFLPGAAGA
jgi:NDP-sugar pyrophosphorylase family protein